MTTRIAYQGLAGVAIGLTERLDLDIGYRYFVAPELELFDDLARRPERGVRC